ncbi:MAG: hypothetical protein EXR99_15775 [Gemmataceae bacterium]|nr:hypothetical protein [Gemmataceae bacterium]
MRLAGWQVLQQVPIWQDSRLSLAFYGMLLAGALLLGAGIIAWIRRRIANEARCLAERPEDQLTEFRNLLDLGELQREEFDKVRKVLGKKMEGAGPVSGEKKPPAPENPPASTPNP